MNISATSSYASQFGLTLPTRLTVYAERPKKEDSSPIAGVRGNSGRQDSFAQSSALRSLEQEGIEVIYAKDIKQEERYSKSLHGQSKAISGSELILSDIANIGNTSDYKRDGLISIDELNASSEILNAKISLANNLLDADKTTVTALDNPYAMGVRESLLGQLGGMNQQLEKLQDIISNYDQLVKKYGDGAQIDVRKVEQLTMTGKYSPVQAIQQEAIQKYGENFLQDPNFKTPHSNGVQAGSGLTINTVSGESVHLSSTDYEVLKKADLNGDGVVSKEEIKQFKEMLQKQLEALQKMESDMKIANATESSQDNKEKTAGLKASIAGIRKGIEALNKIQNSDIFSSFPMTNGQIDLGVIGRILSA